MATPTMHTGTGREEGKRIEREGRKATESYRCRERSAEIEGKLSNAAPHLPRLIRITMGAFKLE